MLFVDEISFNGPLFVHHLSVRLQHLLGCSEPFGGILVIFAGDFYQLPPCNAPALGEALVEMAVHQGMPKAAQDAAEERERAKQVSKKKGKQRKAEPAVPEEEEAEHGADEARPSRFDSMSACARGTALFAKFRRHDLQQPMRVDASEKKYATWLSRFRDTDEAQPVPRALLAALRTLSAGDRKNPLWRFAPIGVLSNRERVHLNAAQAVRWSKYHDEPLFKWKLPLSCIAPYIHR